VSRNLLRLRILTAIIFLINGLSARAEIDHPAGSIPAHRASRSNVISTGHAKSKLIPVTRKMNLVTSSQISEKASDTNVRAKPNTPGSNGAREKSSVKTTKDRRLTLAMAETPEWNGVAKRLSEEDPAHAVTQGVRVEDIVEPSADYQYVSGRRRNPLIPEVVRARSVVQKELSPNDVEIPIINPLQSFELSKLAVIGVWEGDDHVWKALIQTPTNQGIETKLGDPAGNSGGRIMSITPDAVVVREFKLRADGTREYRDVPLYMGSDKPRDDDNLIGGRLILKPGATAPEIEKPESASDAVIAPAAEILPTEEPGTLKNRVRVQPQPITSASADSVKSDVAKSDTASSATAITPVGGAKQEGANSTLTAPAVQGGVE
jgi:Tfp pilus assembly protein PilP